MKRIYMLSVCRVKLSPRRPRIAPKWSPRLRCMCFSQMKLTNETYLKDTHTHVSVLAPPVFNKGTIYDKPGHVFRLFSSFLSQVANKPSIKILSVLRLWIKYSHLFYRYRWQGHKCSALGLGYFHLHQIRQFSLFLSLPLAEHTNAWVLIMYCSHVPHSHRFSLNAMCN